MLVFDRIESSRDFEEQHFCEHHGNHPESYLHGKDVYLESWTRIHVGVGRMWGRRGAEDRNGVREKGRLFLRTNAHRMFNENQYLAPGTMPTYVTTPEQPYTHTYAHPHPRAHTLEQTHKSSLKPKFRFSVATWTNISACAFALLRKQVQDEEKLKELAVHFVASLPPGRAPGKR